MNPSNIKKFPFLFSLLKLENKPDSNNKLIRIKLICNWLTSKDLCNLWNKMSKGNYRWNNIVIVPEDPCDYYVIINKPKHEDTFVKNKTILIRMEPHMDKHPEIWTEEWSSPNTDEFLAFISPPFSINNNEWHLSLSYTQLMNDKIEKDPNLSGRISTVLSSKFYDLGHKFRVSFVKYLEREIPIDVYGDNSFSYDNYKGSLPYHCKDKGILPYCYTLNAENNPIPNYYTEKLIDAILGECYCFYFGPPNITELIDPRCYLILDEKNFENNVIRIREAIKDNVWEKNLPFIREEKKRILNSLQFFPRIENILKEKNLL